MTYVDLNVACAAMWDTLAESDHIIIERRLRQRECLIKKIKPGQVWMNGVAAEVAQKLLRE